MAVRRKKMCLLVYGDRRSFQFSRVKNKSKSKLLSIFCLDIIYYYTLIFFDTILWSGIHVWMFLVVSSGQRYLVRCPRGVDKRWAEDYIHFKSIWANMGGFLDFRSSHRCFFSPLYCLFIISMRDSAKGPMAPLAHRVGLSVTESPNTFSIVLWQVLTCSRHRDPETPTLYTSQLPSMRDVNIPVVGNLG